MYLCTSFPTRGLLGPRKKSPHFNVSVIHTIEIALQCNMAHLTQSYYHSTALDKDKKSERERCQAFSQSLLLESAVPPTAAQEVALRQVHIPSSLSSTTSLSHSLQFFISPSLNLSLLSSYFVQCLHAYFDLSYSFSHYLSHYG